MGLFGCGWPLVALSVAPGAVALASASSAVFTSLVGRVAVAFEAPVAGFVAVTAPVIIFALLVGALALVEPAA